jgi:hypothetical protein
VRAGVVVDPVQQPLPGGLARRVRLGWRWLPGEPLREFASALLV